MTRFMRLLSPLFLGLVVGLVVLSAMVGCSGNNPRAVTTPNRAATLGAGLPDNPLAWKVITTEVDHSHGRMSVLFGNDPAVQYARALADANYPSGAKLALVTWTQQEDIRWFGANIPAAPQSVEFLDIGASAGGQATYDYRVFEGQPLQEAPLKKSSTPAGRVAYMLAERASYMP